MQSKEEIRKEFIGKRNLLDEIEMKIKSGKITESVMNLKEFKEAETVFAYMSMGSEVCTSELVQECWRLGKRLAVPKTITKSKELRFIAINSFENLIKSRFGILEPDGGEVVLPDEKTIIIVPGVVFDREMVRIGYGGGYYDRYLSKVQPLCNVGVCYDLQIAEGLEKSEHDMCVDKIVTEVSVIG